MGEICKKLEWGGWQARTRDENFVRGGGAAAGVLSSVCHPLKPYFSMKIPRFSLRGGARFRRPERRSASFAPTEAWLSSSVTDARIASLDSMRTQLSARGWRFQENGTLLPVYEQKLPNGGGGGGGGPPNGTPKGTLKGDPTVEVVLSRPLDLIRVVCPSGIPLHFLDFRSGAEIRRPPAQMRLAGRPAGRPRPCGRLPTTKNRPRTIKI